MTNSVSQYLMMENEYGPIKDIAYKLTWNWNVKHLPIFYIMELQTVFSIPY